MWAARSADAGESVAATRTQCRHAYCEADQIVGIAFLLNAVAGEAVVAAGRFDWVAATAIEIAHHGAASSQLGGPFAHSRA